MLRLIDQFVPTHCPEGPIFDGLTPGTTGVVWADEKGGTILSAGAEALQPAGYVDVGRRCKWTSLDTTGSRLAVGFDHHIDVHEFPRGGQPASRLAVSETYGCAFLDGGRTLCTAGVRTAGGGGAIGKGLLERSLHKLLNWPVLGSLGPDRSRRADAEVEIQLWDVPSASLIDAQSLPMRDIDYDVYLHPEGEVVAAVAFSGQSEEWMFWAHCAGGRIRMYAEPEIEGVPVPRFHPAGGEFLSAHEVLGLCRMKFPSGEVIGSLRPEQAFGNQDDVDPDDHWFGYDICYLSDHSALVHDECRGFYCVDLDLMRVVDSVLTEIDGVRFGTGGFFSNGFQCLPRMRLLTHDMKYVDRSARNAIRTLRLWDASSLFGPLTGPDPRRPYTAALVGR